MPPALDEPLRRAEEARRPSRVTGRGDRRGSLETR